ncbi:cobalt-precorrin-6A reductase [Commensalibacter sp. TBRC 16381]|uniref:Cobalt-precorrin-6A reductase n=1 Tax=Commensalibacter oyaizuii TaxID=3043873 RepID=A0ABT6Q1E3_9PROT|nr:cobalt-precorrin-6A reductase [Commensalibacter sp. TBRC 16381]MDI2090934.1 cobalt-precorrin-6A reductase [Commensalibacter sp. TBRC 16381]
MLGGTTEAIQLVGGISTDNKYDVIYSLAGVTKAPAFPPQVTTRVGGFGGGVKMAQWVQDHQIDGIIDATHPFAQQITNNAFQVAQITQIPYLRLERPAWEKQTGDRWLEVNSVSETVEVLGQHPQRVFLTIGRKEILPFKACSVQHSYVIRSVDYPDKVYIPQNSHIIQAKGPFLLSDELMLLKQFDINCIVSKNSGGETIYAKIIAARQLGIPVIMVKRPTMPCMPTINSWQEAYQQISQIFG